MRVRRRSVSHPTAGSSHVLFLILAAGLLATVPLSSTLPLFGQVSTRAEEIEREQQKRAVQIEADRPNKVERQLVEIEQKKLPERILSGVNGLGVKLGGLVAGSGFAIGPQYLREDLFSGNMTFRTSAEASLKLYQKYELQMTLPKLANDRVFIDFYSAHRNYPRINFYGLGPRSLKGQRSDYRLEDTATDLIVGVKPVPRVKLGGSVGYLWLNVGPGTDSRLISTEREFTPEQAPGIDRQTDFFRYGTFVQMDYRDNPHGPENGGNYVAQYTWYQDRKLGLHDFRRLDVDLQQYLGFFNKRRVIALRARTVLTDTDSGQTLPFYMNPVLGGSEDLRGFRPFRFSDKNLLSLTGEYRWEAFSGLDMALWVDGGKVFPRRGQLNFSNLEASYGFGLRFNVQNRTFIRLDVGFGREGFQIWFKFHDVFAKHPFGTRSAQPIP
jgi:outer membrane protein assembly factor BamA